MVPLKQHFGCMVEYRWAFAGTAAAVADGIRSVLDDITCDVPAVTDASVRTIILNALRDWSDGSLGPQWLPGDITPHPADLMTEFRTPALVTTHHLCRIELLTIALKVAPEAAADFRAFLPLGSSCDRTVISNDLVTALMVQALVAWFEDDPRSRLTDDLLIHPVAYEAAAF